MKIALCLSKRVESAARTVSTMLEAQRHELNCQTRILPFAFGSVGLLGRPDEPASNWPCWHGTDGSFLVFSGVPIVSGGASPAILTRTHPAVTAALLPGDPERTISALADVDGAFVGIWWSASRLELTVLTDFLGMQPLFRAATNDSTCFASELKAFTHAGVLPVSADAGAWGAMLYLGHLLGERTMLAGATRVRAAQAMTFSSPFDASDRETWQLPPSETRRHESRSAAALCHEVSDAIRADARAYASAYPDAALLLSGGLDSRLILCVCHELGLRPRLLTQSHADENADADACFGEAFARALGMPNKRIPANADYYSTTHYLRFLTLNEVATPSLSLFIANLAPVVRPERHGLWQDAMLGPALHEYDIGGFTQQFRARCESRRITYGKAFAAPWAQQMDAEFESMMKTERAGLPDDPEGVWRFKVRNRWRLRTGANQYQVFDTVTPPLTPGMSKRFWELAANVGSESRVGNRLYRDVFAHLAPRGLDVPAASGTLLLPGNKGALLYHTQRARAALQRLSQRPKVSRQLRALGLPPFEWKPSRYVAMPPSDAELDDPCLNADWMRQQASGSESPHVNQHARESLMYWRAWHQLMRGDLVSAWE